MVDLLDTLEPERYNQMRHIIIKVYTIQDLKKNFPKSYKSVIEKEQIAIQSDDWWTFAHEDLVGQLKHMGFNLKDSEFGFDLYKQQITFKGTLSYQTVSDYICTTFNGIQEKLNLIQAKYNNEIIFDLEGLSYSFSKDESDRHLSPNDFSDLIDIIKEIKSGLLETLQKNLDFMLSEDQIIEFFDANDSEFFANGSSYVS
jgi:hypothetical protein